MQLFSLGKGKFHKENSNLDIEPFTAALEFASEKKAVEEFSCGYDLWLLFPFFQARLSALVLDAEKVKKQGNILNTKYPWFLTR